MSKTYLILSLVGLVVTLNALRPIPGTPFVLPGFFAGWLTSELAPHLLLLHIAANIWFIADGALHGPAGWTGLGLSALISLGLASIVATSIRSGAVMEQALRDGLGPSYEGSELARIAWRQIANPFWFRHREVERIRNVSYAEGGRRNRLDVYRPRAGATGAPVLLQIHGGGWMVSNKDQQGKPIMNHMAARGWVCFAPNYRLSPRAAFPDHLIDVKRAIAWIREHGASYGADPSFILITGGSAGGHLSALAALTPNDPEYQPGFEQADTSVQAAVPMYGVYDFTNTDRKHAATKHRMKSLEWWIMKKKYASSREDFEKASPHFRASAGAPPFFVVHGGVDSLASVAETRRFVERLRSVSKAPVAYAELPGTQHAFDVFHSIRTAYLVAAIERFSAWALVSSQEEEEEEEEEEENNLPTQVSL